MELKSLALAAALTATTAMSVFAASDEVATVEAPAATATVAAVETDAAPLELFGVRVGNPLNPSTWWDGATENTAHADLEPIAINPTDPEFWISFINPETHTRMHATIFNPATAAQFMQAETYTAMLDMGTWMKWMDMDSYAPLYDLGTYTYWMQPGAYLHGVTPANYAAFIDVDNYLAPFTSAFETMGLGS